MKLDSEWFAANSPPGEQQQAKGQQANAYGLDMETGAANATAVVQPVGLEPNLKLEHTETTEKTSGSPKPDSDRRVEELLTQSKCRSNKSMDILGAREQGSFIHRCSSMCRRENLKAAGAAIRQHPMVVILPLLVCAGFMAVGLWGVMSAAAGETSRRVSHARSSAIDKTRSIQAELRAAYMPAKALQSFISRNPNFAYVASVFDDLAEELIGLAAVGSITNLALAPHGQVKLMYPLKGNEKAIGHNLLADPKNKDICLKAIASKNLSLAGPYMLLQGYMGAPARFALFVKDVDANETFGVDNPNAGLMATDCPTCYNPTTRTKFWGFAALIINWENLVNNIVKIRELHEHGHNYRLTRPNADGSQVLLAGQNETLRDPQCISFEVLSGTWSLWITDQNGWVPAWKWPVVATVVIISIIIGFLLFSVLLARVRQRQLLEDVMSANGQLEAAASVLLQEKQRMAALLGRHYDLIACLEGGPHGRGSGGPAMHQTGSFTLGHVDSWRRRAMQSLDLVQEGSHTSSPGAGQGDSYQQVVLHELLGEGAFGKVYKGLWRATEVAVKTVILPGNMSGKEKRAKMALMEGAISASLAHPNIVATYTYHVRPLKDSAAAAPGSRASDDITPSAIIVGGSRGTMSTAPDGDPLQVFKEDIDDNARRGLHSYEVQLVIEYCDAGDLRSALDHGIFFGEHGLNYAAILETAADVAKAMLHLHANNVLHGDLKADNVMLKSCGGVGRGVIAKVADFGLAIQMDYSKTHVSKACQGTVTHMAPEVLLQGQLSKAADVYAFGVTLWELFTSSTPYKGVPGALLGHQISKEGRRPAVTLGTPSGLRALMERCWHPDAAQRPTFDQILEMLQQLRSEIHGPTAPLELPTPRAQPTAGGLPTPAAAAAVAALLGGSGFAPSQLGDAVVGSSGSYTQQQQQHTLQSLQAAADGAGDAQAASAGSADSPSGGIGGAFVSGFEALFGGAAARPRLKPKPKPKPRSRGSNEVVIQVGGRNVGLNTAISSTNCSSPLVLEPICENTPTEP